MLAVVPIREAVRCLVVDTSGRALLIRYADSRVTPGRVGISVQGSAEVQCRFRVGVVAEGLDIDVAAGTVQGDSRDLRLASLQQHPVGAGGCGARFQGSQHHPSEALASYLFPHEHPLDLCRPLRHAWHARPSKSPATHRNGFIVKVANQKRTSWRTEISRGEWGLVRSAVDRDVELLRCRGQRRHVRVLVRHLEQPKLRRHQPSVGSPSWVLSAPETPWQVSRLSQSRTPT